MSLIFIISESLGLPIIFYRWRKLFYLLCAKVTRMISKYGINTPHSKKLFRQITRVVFSTLDHVLRICRTCCNYFLCSSDPGEYNGHNWSTTWLPNSIWSHEKDNFSILSKSKMENSHIFENPSKLSVSQKVLSAVKPKYFCEKKSDELHSKCASTVHRLASKRTVNHVHTTLEKHFIALFVQGVPLIFPHHDSLA